MGNCDAMTAKVGHIVLFIGQETAPDRENWQPEQFAEAARFARSLGIDTIAPKRADGSIEWFHSLAGLEQERAAVLAEGCGFLPFVYCYGPRFGDAQIRGECSLLANIMHVNDGVVAADLETEWNGMVSAAALFDACMRPVPGQLVVTTWADPDQQHWSGGVLRNIAPCVNQWAPQEYDNWLASQEWQDVRDGETCIAPAIDISNEFGANSPVQLAELAHAHGHSCLYLWEYQFARQNPGLVRQVIAAFKGESTQEHQEPAQNGTVVQVSDQQSA